jgi:exopolyphosphatase/pppGpp-phosphohydrolase
MRLAAIDVGSNSVHMIIADVSDEVDRAVDARRIERDPR